MAKMIYDYICPFCNTNFSIWRDDRAVDFMVSCPIGHFLKKDSHINIRSPFLKKK